MPVRTERLELRPVRADDLDVVAALGADERVMTWLGGAQTRSEAQGWLERQIAHVRQHGFGRFLVSLNGVFVGLVGLSRSDVDQGFGLGVEIAWRLAFDHWGKGYAIEAARAVVDEGFRRLDVDEIVGITTPDNARSRRVMDRLGMVHRVAEIFEHPRMPAGDPRRTHVVYRLSRDAWDNRG